MNSSNPYEPPQEPQKPPQSAEPKSLGEKIGLAIVFLVLLIPSVYFGFFSVCCAEMLTGGISVAGPAPEVSVWGTISLVSVFVIATFFSQRFLWWLIQGK